jgi:hypothetical protein
MVLHGNAGRHLDRINHGGYPAAHHRRCIGATQWRSNAARLASQRPIGFEDAAPPELAWQRVRWVLLSAIPGALVLATTSYTVTEISPLPLLWFATTSLGGLAPVLAFSRVQTRPGLPLLLSLAIQGGACLALLADMVIAIHLFRDRVSADAWSAYAWAGAVTVLLFGIPHRSTTLLQPTATVAALGCVAPALWDTDQALPGSFALLIAALWFNCWGCVSVLATYRPPPRRIGEFVIWVAVGTTLGALSMSHMPLVFPYVLWEYPLLPILAVTVRFCRRGTASASVTVQ